MMVDRFSHILTPELRGAAEARGLSVRQLVTLASIVEKETGRPEERPLVAAVYENRLRIGMGLQCDPTVIYALQLAGRYDGNLRRDDLHFDSPYNTYRYAGLPPGPIASPGKASLEAAVRYLASDLGGQRIRVNAISAGPVKTASARAVKDFSTILEKLPAAAPLKRNTDPAEVADAAVFLASDLGRGVTGNILFVDAGMHVMGS